MNIWQELPNHFTVLAPMEGVTDIVFRQVIARAGRPDLFFTEFTNVSSFASEKGRSNALERLEIAESDPPIIAQIWGKNPDHFAKLARELKSLGFQGLDINMGCPDRHVNKAGGGATMIRTPDLAIECINRAKESTDLPVSVKTRLGFTYPDEYQTWLPLLLEQHLAALTIHLRTRKEMSKVPAHYELIPKILNLRDQISPSTKLIINGDIKDLSHAQNLWHQHPEVNGAMIGRGVFDNPFCFTDVKDPSLSILNENFDGNCAPSSSEGHTEPDLALASRTVSELRRDATGADPAMTDVGDPVSEKLVPNRPNFRKLELFNYHLDLFDHYHRTPFEPLKHFFKIYINNFPGASDLRAKLMQCKSTDEVRKIMGFSEKSPNFRRGISSRATPERDATRDRSG